MKISNSKKQLAKIISENGGWREGAEFSAQDRLHALVDFYEGRPRRDKDDDYWHLPGGRLKAETFEAKNVIANWHQTILSRDEYFHLYPAPDADGWIEWSGGECPIEDDGDTIEYKMKINDEIYKDRAFDLEWLHEGEDTDIIAYRLHKPEQSKSTAVGDDETNLAAKEELEALEFEPIKPTIEQLAADYRAKLANAQQAQEEADSHRCVAEAALERLVAAGKAIGLALGVAAPEHELVITDWRDLRVGDEVMCIGNSWPVHFEGLTCEVIGVERENYHGDAAIRVQSYSGGKSWGLGFKFIRRP